MPDRKESRPRLPNLPQDAAAAVRPRRTRRPSDDGGPDNLKRTRADQKEITLRSAETIFAKLKALGLDLSEENWKLAMAQSDPDGASWRATYRPHVAHLFTALRNPAAGGGLTAKQATTLRDQRDRAIRCVAERDEEIKRLRDRIAELEAENLKLGRGTRARRTRSSHQARQGASDDTGSD